MTKENLETIPSVSQAISHFLRQISTQNISLTFFHFNVFAKEEAAATAESIKFMLIEEEKQNQFQCLHKNAMGVRFQKRKEYNFNFNWNF